VRCRGGRGRSRPSRVARRLSGLSIIGVESSEGSTMVMKDTSHPLAEAEAAEAIGRAAGELRDILVAMAGRLEPFPYFLGSIEVQAVEAEPGGASRADRGCIVVCGDGELYEFTMNVNLPGAGPELGLDRDDTVKRVELPPEDYLPYAYNAIKELGALIGEQEARAKKYTFDKP